MTRKIARPMLAGKADLDRIRYPVSITPKLDGIRCLCMGGHALTRNFKSVPNLHVQRVLESAQLDGTDGELVIPNKTFQEISSAIMSRDGQPAFEYWVFDYFGDGLDVPYLDRITKVLELVTIETHWLIPVMPIPAIDKEGLMVAESFFVKRGYEGIIIRDPQGVYKEGRSTVAEGGMLKLKRFQDAEAIVMGVKELTHNLNKAEKDAFGLTKRSSHLANKVAGATLGALIVRDVTTGVEFDVGTGFDGTLRKKIWNDTKTYIGSLIKYKYQTRSRDGKPIFPVFIGFRNPNDL